MTGATTDLAAENARLRAKIQELTDRVITNIEARSDAEDLQRELDNMRRQWAGVPTTDEAITWLRDLVREFSPHYETGAITVAMPAATAMKLVAQLDEWRTQVDTLLAREAARAHEEPTGEIWAQPQTEWTFGSHSETGGTVIWPPVTEAVARSEVARMRRNAREGVRYAVLRRECGPTVEDDGA